MPRAKNAATPTTARTPRRRRRAGRPASAVVGPMPNGRNGRRGPIPRDREIAALEQILKLSQQLSPTAKQLLAEKLAP